MSERTAAVPVTVCFVRAGTRLLLLRVAKHKDRFPGLWNGLGGHVQPGEDVRSAARREILEESGLEPEELALRAVIHETGLLGRAHLLFVFTAEVSPEVAARPLAAGREGDLAWFETSELPWTDLVPDLRELLPRLLASRELLFGTQHFDGRDRSLKLELQS